MGISQCGSINKILFNGYTLPVIRQMNPNSKQSDYT